MSNINKKKKKEKFYIFQTAIPRYDFIFGRLKNTCNIVVENKLRIHFAISIVSKNKFHVPYLTAVRLYYSLVVKAESRQFFAG